MSRWQTLEPTWQRCFEQVHRAYLVYRTVPIGGVIVDGGGHVVASERNQGKLRHAETVALGEAPEALDLRQAALYSHSGAYARWQREAISPADLYDRVTSGHR